MNIEERVEILLIEDNPGDARLIEILLLESDLVNLKVTNKKTLQDGLKYLSENDQVNTILLDLSLPDSRGFETITKCTNKFPERNFIVLTGFSDKNIGVKAVKAGAQDFLVKGDFDADILTKVIRYTLDKQFVLEESKKTISAKEVQINLIINITSGIKKDLPLVELLNVYKSSLQWIGVSKELIFFLYENNEWFELTRYPEDSKSQIITSYLSDLLFKYQEATYINDSDKENAYNFDFIIPIRQTNIIYGAVFLKGIDKSFEEKKKFMFLFTDIISLAIINKEFENLRNRKERIKTGILILSELLELQTVFLQYLNSIPDYIEGTKGKLINFIFKRHPKGIEWEIELNSEISLDEAKEYLSEYLSYIFDRKLELKNNITRSTILENEIKLLELKHSQQLSHVENQVKIYQVENNLLKDNLSYFKKLLSTIVSSEPDNKLLLNKDNLKKKISNGNVKEVIEVLINNEDCNQYFDEIIMLKENYLSLRKKKRLGIITDSEESISRNRINDSLLEIINFF